MARHPLLRYPDTLIERFSTGRQKSLLDKLERLGRPDTGGKGTRLPLDSRLKGRKKANVATVSRQKELLCPPPPRPALDSPLWLGFSLTATGVSL